MSENTVDRSYALRLNPMRAPDPAIDGEMAYKEDTPEIKLLTAIMERAVRDLRLAWDICDQASYQGKKTAIQWVLSKNTKAWSFFWVAREIKLSFGFVARVIEIAKSEKKARDTEKIAA